MNMLSVLRRAGRGIGRLPRTVGEAFVTRTPIMGEGSLPSIPYSTDPEEEYEQIVGPGGELIWVPKKKAEPTTFESGPLPTGIPQVVGQRIRPSRLTRALPGALAAGIEAAATPNIVAPGGLPVPGGASIMRALQQARDYGQQQDILGYNLQRQGEQDRMGRDTAASEADERAARAESFRATATAQRTLAGQREKTVREKYDELVALGFPVDDARLIAAGKPPEKPPQMVEVTPEVGAEYGVRPDAAGRYHVPMVAFGAHIRAQGGEPRNPTEASLAAAAAGGDKVAQAALKLLQGQRTGPDERQKRTRITAAWASYQNSLNEAEQQFQAAKAGLDRPGVRPGTVNSSTGMKSEASWQDYDDRLHDLESNLQTKKNNAQGALEAALAEFEVAFQPTRYPHPSTQRRVGVAPGPAPKPAAAKPSGAPKTFEEFKALSGMR